MGTKPPGVGPDVKPEAMPRPVWEEKNKRCNTANLGHWDPHSFPVIVSKVKNELASELKVAKI